MPSGKPEPDAPDADAAEAAAAEAEARAEAARTRANELRRKLEAASADDTAEADEATSDDVDDVAEADAEPAVADEAVPPKRQRLRLPGLKAVAAGLVVLVIAGLSSVTGWMLWEHRKATDERHQTAEYSAAARQGVVNLMSMDYTQAKESVQRIIDGSIGKFKNNFQDTSGDLIKALQDSKMITKVTVNDTAVEGMDDETATVLVAATSHREGPDAPKEDQQPRVWRMVVTLERDGGQIKLSDVEFA
jgi:Mce-associated membrane protein